MQTKLAPGLVEVFAFMAKTGMALADLIEVGGEHLESSSAKDRESQARREMLVVDGEARCEICRSREFTRPNTRQVDPQAT
jgi:hypothetical protein